MNEKEFVLKHANKEMINLFVEKIGELQNILGKGSYNTKCQNCNQWIENELKSLKFLDILKAEVKYHDAELVNDDGGKK